MPIVSGIYGLSEFSDNKLWIVDSPELRLLLKNNYGNPIVEFPGHNYAYIEVDKLKRPGQQHHHLHGYTQINHLFLIFLRLLNI